MSTALASAQTDSFVENWSIAEDGELWGQMLDKATDLINKAQPTKDRCLLHTGAVNEAGYAMTYVRRKRHTASRLVLCCWTRKPLDYPFDACHDTPTCQNRHCIAPWHLAWDTHKSNCEKRDTEARVV